MNAHETEVSPLHLHGMTKSPNNGQVTPGLVEFQMQAQTAHMDGKSQISNPVFRKSFT